MEAIDHFKEENAETGIPYRMPVNLYPAGHAGKKRKLPFSRKEAFACSVSLLSYKICKNTLNRRARQSNLSVI